MSDEALISEFDEEMLGIYERGVVRRLIIKRRAF